MLIPRSKVVKERKLIIFRKKWFLRFYAVPIHLFICARNLVVAEIPIQFECNPAEVEQKISLKSLNKYELSMALYIFFWILVEKRTRESGICFKSIFSNTSMKFFSVLPTFSVPKMNGYIQPKIFSNSQISG